MDWFISDTHFGHKKIIEYTNRPFSSVDDMDEAIIQRWNYRVGKDDTVFHLGDFCLGGEKEAHRYFIQLNGKITVLANPWHHDKNWLKRGVEYKSYKGHPVEIVDAIHVLEYPQFAISTYPRAVVLSHYPQLVWERKHFLSWHMYGHIHNLNAPYFSEGVLALNVCVDATNFRPVSIEEVSFHMLLTEAQLGLKPV